MRILSGGAGLLFKGSGFYQTDYKKSGGAGSKESSEKQPAKPETKSEPSATKGESKPSESSSAKPKGDSSS